MSGKRSPKLQATVVFDDTTFEVFAYRPLTEDEARREVAGFLREDRLLERGLTYQVFSMVGLEESSDGGHTPNP